MEKSNFVWIKPTEGHFSARLVSGKLHFAATSDQPTRVTRREWETFLKAEGCFEICSAPEEPKTKSKEAKRT